MKKTEAPPEHKLLFDIPLATQPEVDSKLEVHVVFTNTPSTMCAVERAAVLAKDLHARLRLLVPQVVSYALPLDSPPVLVEFNESRFRRFAAQLQVDMNVEIYLCRDASEMLAQRLPERSLVVIGGRRHWWWPAEVGWLAKVWWLTDEWRLARRLQRLGHQVALVSAE